MPVSRHYEDGPNTLQIDMLSRLGPVNSKQKNAALSSLTYGEGETKCDVLNASLQVEGLVVLSVCPIYLSASNKPCLTTEIGTFSVAINNYLTI